MKDVSKHSKIHFNEFGLTRTEFCKSQSYLGQPPISWKICYFSPFCYTGVRVNVIARLYIHVLYANVLVLYLDTYRVQVYYYASNSDHSGIAYSIFTRFNCMVSILVSKVYVNNLDEWLLQESFLPCYKKLKSSKLGSSLKLNVVFTKFSLS